MSSIALAVVFEDSTLTYKRTISMSATRNADMLFAIGEIGGYRSILSNRFTMKRRESFRLLNAIVENASVTNADSLMFSVLIDATALNVRNSSLLTSPVSIYDVGLPMGSNAKQICADRAHQCESWNIHWNHRGPSAFENFECRLRHEVRCLRKSEELARQHHFWSGN